MPIARILPNPENGKPEELEIAIKCASSQRSRVRLLAMKALMMDLKFEVVAKLFGVSERTIVRWVKAWNEKGIDGVIERRRAGRLRKIPADKVKNIEELVEHPQKVNQTHWTGKKLHGYLRGELNMSVGYSTVMRFLHDQGFRLKVPQTWSDRQDEAIREAFCKRMNELMADDEVELWFADETGVEGDPRPWRRWIKRGEKGRVIRNGDHIRMNVTGMVCPRTGEAFLCEFPESDTDIFQAFLDEANKSISFSRPRQILVLDNASWHKAARLNWGKFQPLYLPPYSPDLNPIERLWLLIKAEWFADFVAKTQEELIQRLDIALNWAINRKNENIQACSIKTKL